LNSARLATKIKEADVSGGSRGNAQWQRGAEQVTASSGTFEIGLFEFALFEFVIC